MLGRIALIWLNKKVCEIRVSNITISISDSMLKVGERRIMFIYAFLAIQYVISYHTPSLLLTLALRPRLEVTVWVVPSLLENALAISCIGLLLGPMYPILMSYCTQILPRWLLTGCVGWIGGFGMTGSAALPFVTGLLASKFGIGSLQPL